MGNVYREYAFRIAIVTTVLLLIGTVVSDAAMLTADEAPSSWWDASRHFRLPVTVGAAGFERFEKPVEVDLDFTQLLSELGQTGTLDENSIRVVETNSIGKVLNASVPSQFNKDTDFNATTKASGTIVFIMDGVTQASGTRYYYIYFDLTGASYSPLPVVPLVTLTDNIMDAGQLSYKIEASGSTYLRRSCKRNNNIECG